MEILLVDNFSFNATRLRASPTILICSVPNYNARSVRGNQSHDQYLKKVLAASKGKEYCIHIKRNPANPGERNKCVVRLHNGFFSENFKTLWIEGLKVRIQLAFSVNVYATAGGFSSPVCRLNPLQLSAEMLVPKPSEKSSLAVDFVNETCITNGVFLEATDVPVHYRNWKSNWMGYLNPEFLGSATITLFSGCEKCVNVSHGIARVTREILDSKLSSDVIISAKDGSEHNCIKAFLAVQSSVFKAMLETDMKESKTNKIEMEDMTSDGVKALLEYLYTFELDQAIKCEIALELLEAGHKYDIESLEKYVASLILSKGEDWFSVDMAFSLFLFTRKVNAMKDIKMKAVSMLTKKPKEFLECKDYVRKQQENLAEVADATKELFCLGFMK